MQAKTPGSEKNIVIIDTRHRYIRLIIFSERKLWMFALPLKSQTRYVFKPDLISMTIVVIKKANRIKKYCTIKTPFSQRKPWGSFHSFVAIEPLWIPTHSQPARWNVHFMYLAMQCYYFFYNARTLKEWILKAIDIKSWMPRTSFNPLWILIPLEFTLTVMQKKRIWNGISKHVKRSSILNSSILYSKSEKLVSMCKFWFSSKVNIFFFQFWLII